MIPSLIRRVLVAAALAALAPGAARACSCALPFLLEPREGATDVPTNAKIWHLPTSPEPGATYRLEGPNGAVAMDKVAVAPSLGSGIPGFVFTPRQPLTPGATYRFVVCLSPTNCLSGKGFTVGSRRLDSAALPSPLSREPYFVPGSPNSSCGPAPIQGITFRFDWDGIALLMDVDGDNAFSPATLQDLLKHTAIKAFSPELISAGPSFCSMDWPRDPSGNPVLTPRLRFGVVDIAGNFSGWTPSEQVALPSGPIADAGAPDAALSDGGPPDDVRAPEDVAPEAAPVSPDAAPPAPDAAPDSLAPLPEPPSLHAGSGCGCALGAAPRSAPAGLVVVLAAALLARRSRRVERDHLATPQRFP